MSTKLYVASAALAALTFIAATAPADAQRRHWRHHHNHHGYGYGYGAAAGGFVAGALIGSALTAPRYYGGPGYYGGPNHYGNAYASSSGVDYCVQRFRSYDVASGTYLGYDGQRHSCP